MWYKEGLAIIITTGLQFHHILNSDHVSDSVCVKTKYSVSFFLCRDQGYMRAIMFGNINMMVYPTSVVTKSQCVSTATMPSLNAPSTLHQTNSYGILKLDTINRNHSVATFLKSIPLSL